jgi:hypothetical protein
MRMGSTTPSYIDVFCGSSSSCSFSYCWATRGPYMSSRFYPRPEFPFGSILGFLFSAYGALHSSFLPNKEESALPRADCLGLFLALDSSSEMTFKC